MKKYRGFLLACLLVLFAGLVFSKGLNFSGAAEPLDVPVGFAATGSGMTGGEGGKTVTVSTAEELIRYMQESDPYVIQVSGTISLNGIHKVTSNKTIIGLGSSAHITGGGLRISGAQDVIVRNITFSNSPDDAIGVDKSSKHVWIDHNNFMSSADGLVDIKEASSYVTVSWNKFYNHDKTALIGHNDNTVGDMDNLKVTYHHNWFDGTVQRHPRVRYGEVHVYNNYYSGVQSYGIGVGVEAKIYSEQNYFENTKKAVTYIDKPEKPGYIKDIGSYFVDTPQPELRLDGVTWNPGDYYEYKADKAADVKSIVMNGAGVGKIPSRS
ncbi:pectate lyase family protein [Paenibacillus alkalitolerans]|uniref:pectate lyase family protein n=1 Tax=Paenibacillus alkalitolerans TaxID=2799335 RepID=UPI0018F31EDD|nr:hypothetical protein [Paenibacillus alkalitolerans]